MISSHAFANTIQLYSESHARRLFKARHHEIDKMHILAHTLTDASPSSFKSVLKPRGCTVYAFTIRSDAQTTRAKETQGEWLLARRYSEFASFRAELLRLIRQWEGKLEQCTHKIQSREFELVSNSLRRPITPSFPRKHMRGDNTFIVQERRRGLREFVRKLLDAYADISVYLFNSPTSRQEAGAGQYLRDIHDRLETFLEVPAAQKELERRHTAAVLALEDVQLEKTQERGHPSRTCCICLDDYECADEQSDLEAVLVEALARDKMVKLPCGHHYHEDCVIEWFNTSVTCPLCRKPAVKEGPSSVFNVSS